MAAALLAAGCSSGVFIARKKCVFMLTLTSLTQTCAYDA